jgi:hypothetical protein
MNRHPFEPRCAAQVQQKAAAGEEKCLGYVFRLDGGRCLDPTDAAGNVSARPGALLLLQRVGARAV